MTHAPLKKSEVESLFAQTLQGDYEDDGPWMADSAEIREDSVDDAPATCSRRSLTL
jgi:hypothetical protein